MMSMKENKISKNRYLDLQLGKDRDQLSKIGMKFEKSKKYNHTWCCIKSILHYLNNNLQSTNYKLSYYMIGIQKKQ